MPNLLAHVVFYCWPLVMVLMFRSMPLAQALSVSLIGAYLFVPLGVRLDLTVVPPLDKTSLPSFTALLLCLLLAQRDRMVERVQAAAMRGGTRGKAQVESVPRRGLPRVMVLGLLGLTLVFPVATVLNNSDTLVYGPRVLRGLRPWDMGSILQGVFVTMIPFMLGMWYLGTTQRHVVLLRALVVLGLVYSLLAAYEIRMSPQLNVRIYGFFPHSWLQHVRGDGFRPLVFLGHGLWLAIFMASATLAACVLWRQALRERIAAAPWMFAAVWMFLILMLSRSLGAQAIAILIAPIILLAPPRLQIIAAAVIAMTVLTFPMLRGAGYVPTDSVVQAVERINPARASSLQFRFDNEDLLLEKANLKPLTGWGTWGRNRVFDEETGRDLSVTDGAWVIYMGVYGWIGYIAAFGLLTLPVVILAIRRREQLAPASAGLALVSAAGLMDLIPNSTLTPVTWLIGGALAGRCLREERPVTARRRSAAKSQTPAPDAAPAPPAAGVHVRQPRGPRPGALALSAPAQGHHRQTRD